MHKTMANVASLEKIEIIRSRELMPSEARLKFLKKMIILGPKTAILGPQFVEFWCWGLIFGGQGGPGPQAPPGSAPECNEVCISETSRGKYTNSVSIMLILDTSDIVLVM